ncbi:alginate export family protein, partial [Burkholderia sp. Bp8963]
MRGRRFGTAARMSVAAALVFAGVDAACADTTAASTTASTAAPTAAPTAASTPTSTTASAAAASIPAAASASAAAGGAASASTCNAKRPVVLFNRWQEDWSVLANPCVPRAPLDGLKYIPLGGDPKSYLSLGVNLRERVESNNAPLFGIGSAQSDTYLLQRIEVHADAHLGEHWQFFAQLADARAFGKNTVTPVDKNLLDL